MLAEEQWSKIGKPLQRWVAKLVTIRSAWVCILLGPQDESN